MTGADIAQKAKGLRRFWQKRNDKFKEWYKLIQMIDELEQENMESFVGNDPRAAYNLVVHMLDTKIPHRLPSEDIDQELVGAAQNVEKFFAKAWGDIFRRYRQGLSEGFMRDLVGFLIATGWYSVFSQVTPDGKGCGAEVWNPATVYPNFGFEGLIEVSHIIDLTPVEARSLVFRRGWNFKVPEAKVTLYDYWWVDDHSVVHNAIALDNTRVKDDTEEPRFRRIPVFVGAVGGLPDTGPLQGSSVETWKAEKGQSVVATNVNIYRYWNKWWTFSMQLLRDTAQPRIKERSKGDRIVKPEDIFKRGAIFRMGLDEDVDFLQPPVIPVELRTTQLDLEAQLQRGGVSWALYGNVQQQLSSYVFAQIAASAQQMVRPFHQGIVNLLSDIDNFWIDMIRDNKYRPYGFTIPSELPDDFVVTADFDIKIPGDLTRRATEARMLNPTFRLSQRRVYDEVFPEVQNPLLEVARLHSEDAQEHPIHRTLVLIESLRRIARDLEREGNMASSMLYDKAAAFVEKTMTIEAEQPTQAEIPQGYLPPELGGM